MYSPKDSFLSYFEARFFILFSTKIFSLTVEVQF